MQHKKIKKDLLLKLIISNMLVGIGIYLMLDFY